MEHITPQKILISASILFLCGYALFNSRFILKGPEIAIAGLDEKNELIKTDTRNFSLQGTVLHSSFISINNRPILIDESGKFDEKLLLSNGISIIDIYAKDKFGKEVRKKIDVVYTGPENQTTDIDNIALRALSGSSTDISEESENLEISSSTDSE